VVVDITAHVAAVPGPGADVLAEESQLTPGGSFNVLLAATRQGLRGAYAGASGTGPFGDLVRARMRDAGVEVLLPPSRHLDTGYAVTLVEPDGERRFVTAFGAEADLTESQLGGLALQPTDSVHVSGYGLLSRTNADVIPPWLLGLTAGHLVVFDPGPLVAGIPASALRAVCGRADWVSCNEREALLMTGEPTVTSAARALAVEHTSVVVRLAAKGCLVSAGGPPVPVPGFATKAVDTTGAGDAHVGAFCAALVAGHSPVQAARRANACAASAVARRGPATAPSRDEVEELLAR